MTLSGTLIERARLAYVRCVQERLSEHVFTIEDNNYSENAIDVFILSVTALEAFINEAAFSPMARSTSRLAMVGDMLEDLDIRRKYVLVPQLAWGQTYDPGVQPYQDFEMLVRLRNDLVHYKMKFYSHGQEPGYAKTLSQRGLLLLPKPPDLQARFPWPTELLTSKAALWAHNTACRMVRSFIAMADEETTELHGSLANKFREIPLDYWKTILEAST